MGLIVLAFAGEKAGGFSFEWRKPCVSYLL
jgi:hypothetical protein